jgi:hypothetical protein
LGAVGNESVPPVAGIVWVVVVGGGVATGVVATEPPLQLATARPPATTMEMAATRNERIGANIIEFLLQITHSRRHKGTIAYGVGARSISKIRSPRSLELQGGWCARRHKQKKPAPRSFAAPVDFSNETRLGS